MNVHTPSSGSPRPVRVAMVGLGWAANSIWLPRLREHPGFAVAALVDPDPAARARAVQDRTGTELLAGVDELDRNAVDLAIVAAPNHLHSTLACSVLANGIPVFVEKPVCLDSVEADRLAAAAAAGGGVLLAGSAARYRTDVLALRDLVPQLGTIRHVGLSWVRARGVPDAGGWFTNRELSGGGALVDLGWHLLDLLTPLLGPVRFERVLGTVSGDFVARAAMGAGWRGAQSGAAAPPRGPDRVDVEDTARAFLVTGEGVGISLRASWASHEPVDVTTVTIDGSAASATLRCTLGFSPNRLAASELTLAENGRVTPVPFQVEPVGAEYRRQVDELPRLLADRGAGERTAWEIRRTIAVIEQIYAAASPQQPAAGALRATRTPGRAARPALIDILERT